jgi:hypothetical protein
VFPVEVLSSDITREIICHFVSFHELYLHFLSSNVIHKSCYQQSVYSVVRENWNVSRIYAVHLFEILLETEINNKTR